jgi:hypothetical protein
VLKAYRLWVSRLARADVMIDKRSAQAVFEVTDVARHDEPPAGANKFARACCDVPAAKRCA